MQGVRQRLQGGRTPGVVTSATKSNVRWHGLCHHAGAEPRTGTRSVGSWQAQEAGTTPVTTRCSTVFLFSARGRSGRAPKQYSAAQHVQGPAPRHGCSLVGNQKPGHYLPEHGPWYRRHHQGISPGTLSAPIPAHVPRWLDTWDDGKTRRISVSNLPSLL